MNILSRLGGANCLGA